MLLNKVDLLPHVPFRIDRFLATVREVNPKAQVLQMSATSGAGLPAWYDWLSRSLSASGTAGP